MKILHIITSLSTGGAEMMLYKLLNAMNSGGMSCAVCSLADDGTIGKSIEEMGVSVYSLKMKKRFISPISLLRLRDSIKRYDPDIIQGWMYHGNLAASVGRALSRNKMPVLWNVRQTLYNIEYEKRMTALVIKCGIHASRHVDKIVYNSSVSARQHTSLGYPEGKAVVIPNGFDFVRYRPSNERRRSMRKELNVNDDDVLIGLISRYHPMKDHENFLKAAAIVKRTHKTVKFLMVGHRIDNTNAVLTEKINAYKLNNNVLLLGERNDIDKVLPALDIVVSSSAWGEGFPNIIGEAMACGVPCVVTDVGDSAHVVGDTGVVVEPCDSFGLGEGLLRIIRMAPDDRKKMGDAARERIKKCFGIDVVAAKYKELYTEVYDNAH